MAAQMINFIVEKSALQWTQLQQSIYMIDEACRKTFPSGQMIHPKGLMLLQKGMAKTSIKMETIRQRLCGTPLSSPSSSSSSFIMRGGGPTSPGFAPSPTRQGSLFAAAAGESSSAGADTDVAPSRPGAPPHEG